ncbi:MAG: hypothetical protein RL186_613 [Pseudomonadota bacterium]
MALWNFKSKEQRDAADDVAILRERDGVAVVPSEQSAPAPVVAATTIGAGTIVQGSILAQGALNIDGQVQGDVRGGAVLIGTSADVAGDVTAETATIRGRVVGNVRARTIQLAAGGSVLGDLSHAILIIEEGGVFEGRSKRSPDPLNELALTAPQTTEGEAPKGDATPEAPEPAKADVVETKAEEPTLAAAKEEPGKHLDDPPRSAVADVLGEQFAAAD